MPVFRVYATVIVTALQYKAEKHGKNSVIQNIIRKFNIYEYNCQ